MRRTQTPSLPAPESHLKAPSPSLDQTAPERREAALREVMATDTAGISFDSVGLTEIASAVTGGRREPFAPP
jgi:hypothetical protein